MEEILERLCVKFNRQGETLKDSIIIDKTKEVLRLQFINVERRKNNEGEDVKLEGPLGQRSKRISLDISVRVVCVIYL